MKAEEALKTTIDNAYKIEFFYAEIKRRSEEGCNHCLFIGIYITFDIFGKLMADGYQISTGTNPIGESFMRVQW